MNVFIFENRALKGTLGACKWAAQAADESGARRKALDEGAPSEILDPERWPVVDEDAERKAFLKTLR